MKKLLAILFAVTTLNTASASATEYIDISTPNIDSSFIEQLQVSPAISINILIVGDGRIMTVLCVAMANVIWESKVIIILLRWEVITAVKLVLNIELQLTPVMCFTVV